MKRLIVPGLMLFAFAGVANAQRSAAAPCDRDCLRGFITQYPDAMLAHNPKALPVAGTMRFTENTKTMPLGEGLWKNASKLQSYRQDILDVREGIAASHVVVEESGMPVMLALRLKIANKQLTEIETMVTRNMSEGAIFSFDQLKTANPAMNVVPDKAQLMSRAEDIRIAEFYPAGLKVGGTFAAVDAPFAPDTMRIENGRIMAGPGAREGSEKIKTQTVTKHPAVVSRVAAVDEEMGIVLLWMDFGDTGSYGPGNALTTFEAFKVYGGQPSGWPNYEVKSPK